MMPWRSIALVMLLGLLAWLFLGGSPVENQWASLRNGQKQGLLATLTKEQTADLALIVGVALRITQTGVSFDVNGNKNTARLAVISYRSDLDHRWNFGAGNVVYNTFLDAIFIDEALVDVGRFATPGNPSAPTPMRGFILFALLHELGHRSLHSGRSNSREAIAGDESVSVLETAADDYALNALGRALADPSIDLSGIFRDDLNKEIGLDCSELRHQELTYCRLATALWTASQIYLVGETPFPPFYSNETHPPLTQRAVRLLANPSLTVNLSPPFADHAKVLCEWFRRLQIVVDHGARELFVDRAVEAATPVSDGWLLVAGDSFAVFADSAFSRSGLRRNLVVGNWNSVSNRTADVPFRYAHPFECEPRVLCVADLKTGVVQVIGVPNRTELIGLPEGESGQVLAAMPPGRWLYRVNDDTLQIFSGYAWHTTTMRHLRSQIPDTPETRGLSLRVLNAGLDWIGFGLVESGDSDFLEGWCWAPVEKNIGPIVCRTFDGHSFPLRNKIALLAKNDGDFILYYATSNDSDTDIDILSPTGVVLAHSAIATHDQALKVHSKLWSAYPPVWWGDVATAGDGSLIVSYVGDSVYRVSPTGTVSILMHPSSLLSLGPRSSAALVPNGSSQTVYSISWNAVTDARSRAN